MLELASVAAHSSERKAAPIACWLAAATTSPTRRGRRVAQRSAASARASASGSLTPRSAPAAGLHRSRLRARPAPPAPRPRARARHAGRAARRLIAGGERLPGGAARRARRRAARSAPAVTNGMSHASTTIGPRRALERGDEAGERMRRRVRLLPHRHVERRQLRPALRDDDRLEPRRRAAASGHAMSGRPPRARRPWAAPCGDDRARRRPPEEPPPAGRRRAHASATCDLARLPSGPRERELDRAPAALARHRGAVGRRACVPRGGRRRPPAPRRCRRGPPSPPGCRAPRRSRTARPGACARRARSSSGSRTSRRSRPASGPGGARPARAARGRSRSRSSGPRARGHPSRSCAPPR